jgi:hypothetical protein
MTVEERSELRPAYRTLNEPTRLLGLPVSGWVALVLGGALAYAWLRVSPLPWRANFSTIVITVGVPVGVLALREPGTIGPGKLLAAVLAWRMRATLAVCPDEQHPVRRGAIRLDTSAESLESFAPDVDDLPWASHGWEESG